MPRQLKVCIGQCSEAGRKQANQDFYGAIIPRQPLLGSKGVAIALADGISSSMVSRLASEAAIKTFLEDYYCTSDTWSVKTSAQRVIAATNSWLYAQTRRSAGRYDKDKGYVCTLSVVVIKSTTAHIFHIGDARVYRVNGSGLEQLTIDHRVALAPDESYLGRALGVNAQVEIDYHGIAVAPGDVLVLATDGAYDHVAERFVSDAIRNHADDLDGAARAIVAEAHRNGSPDNLTVQIVRVDDVPDGDTEDVIGDLHALAPAPLLEAGTVFEGYRILRELHASSRSHVYLAADIETERLVAIKVPSVDLRDDAAYLKQFMLEEWVLRRVNSPHLLKLAGRKQKPGQLYIAAEFVEGQSLRQWMIDNPKPDLETVRRIVEQIARGLQALHRMEMLHQDLRPENIMIEKTGMVKIIDFGSVYIAGVTEASPDAGESIRGTLQYTAPEYFLGEGGSTRSDLFSLGVIAYQLLTGRLPYDAQVTRLRNRSQQNRLRYRTVLHEDRDIPVWFDLALKRAVHLDPDKRYEELSEFMFDLRHPNPAYVGSGHRPLMERDPLLFWKIISGVLALTALALLVRVLVH